MKQTSLLRKGHLIDITVKNIWFYFFQRDSEFLSNQILHKKAPL